MRTLAVSTAVNEDLDFLANELCQEHLTYGDMFVGHPKTMVDVLCDARLTLVAVGASSVFQCVNLIRVLLIIFPLINKKINLLITSPSPINIFLIPFFAIYVRGGVTVAVHDVSPHYGGLKGWLYKLQNNVIFKYSSKIILYSNYSAGEAARLYPNAPADLVVKILRTPAEIVCYECDIPRRDEREFDFVWWGRAEDYKGVMDLPVIAMKYAEHNKNFLVISDLAKYPNIRARLDMLDNVKLISGRLPLVDLMRNLLTAKVNICPYVSATQSGVIPFCAALGLPSLVYDVGALREQVASLQCGEMVSDVSGANAFEFLASVNDSSFAEIKRNYFLDC